ncbi:hypothetical protein ACFO3O_09190 [Dokdonia ponticola]|uniref:DUF4403 family protein n=1 Tax=Dokdonia ponticola TaxID=2041041 RepID=A0ABV9HWG4_9FLAO
MKTFCIITFLAFSTLSFSQKRGQVVALVPQNFTIESNSKASEYGKALCLEIQHRMPEYDDSYSVDMLEQVEINIENMKSMSLGEAESKGLVYLKHNGWLGYSFQRGENLPINIAVEINMRGSLYDNVIAPKNTDYDKSILPADFKDNDILSKLQDAQEDIWFNQVKRDLFDNKSSLVSDGSMTIESSPNEFINNLKKVLEDDDICKPSKVELCVDQRDVPVMSITFECELIDITLSTQGDITVGRSIENKYISLNHDKTVNVYDLFKEDIGLNDNTQKELCTFDKVCFSLDKYGLTTNMPNCSITKLALGEVIISDESTGNSVSLSFK